MLTWDKIEEALLSGELAPTYHGWVISIEQGPFLPQFLVLDLQDSSPDECSWAASVTSTSTPCLRTLLEALDELDSLT